MARIKGGTNSDILYGTVSDDTYYGYEGDDTFFSSRGNDTFDGGKGFDMVDYSPAATGISVSLQDGYGSDGDGGKDTYIGIENISGSRYSDRIGGNGFDNNLHGNDGNDTLLGLGGHDTLFGDAGDDTLHGDDGNDTLYGGADNDTLFGGAGADVLDGGSGSDTVDYSGSPCFGRIFVPILGTYLNFGVAVDLRTGLGTYSAEGDTYVSIENIRGSAYDDGLIGNADANTISGRDGDDTIIGGAGADHLDGGTGVDWLSYYGPSSSSGVNVNLNLNTASGGDASGDTITGFENVAGTDFGDVLVGSDGVDNKFFGNGGGDVINGGSGRDLINGGAGDDRLTGGADGDKFYFLAQEYQNNQNGNDVIFDFTVGTDTLKFDSRTIGLPGSGNNTIDDLKFTQTDTGTMIKYDFGFGGDHGTIYLLGVDMNALLAHAQTDFLFT